MAQQFSFDVVSNFDTQEMDNAVNQARKEVEQRYDFKGFDTEIDLNLKEKTITLHVADDMKLRALHEILNGKMIKRGISLKALEYGTAEPATGGSLRQVVKLKSGLESDQAKVITKMVKDLKLKVQAQIQGEEVRITGKSKDDLQAAIAALKGQSFDFPIQFTNYR
ncbi:MAG: YajQ family cyclic di-GMP-binding protein [bacterium]